jgi:hypothetical protein
MDRVVQCQPLTQPRELSDMYFSTPTAKSIAFRLEGQLLCQDRRMSYCDFTSVVVM